jgi:hypothetical protein
MEIRSPSQLLAPAIVTKPAQQVAPLKLGTILDVMVQARLGENRFLLLLPNGESLTGFSNMELPVGQTLQVQINRLGTTPELRILPSVVRSEGTLSQALRELLPKQTDIGDFTAMLKRLSAFDPSALPEPVRVAAERVTAAMAQAEQIGTADGLQKALRNSGLFLEAGLAAMLTESAALALPGNDLKAHLLKLLATLQEADANMPSSNAASPLLEKGKPSAQQPALNQPASEDRNGIGDHETLRLDKLVQKTEGALAKITVDQLSSLPRDDGSISLQLSIPFVAGTCQDNAKLFINSDGAAARDENSPATWSAMIELEPPGIGRFNARIIWNGTHIDACLWSDREETGSLLHDHCELLRSRLEQAGLQTGNITIYDSPPPFRTETVDTPPLLDFHA